MNWVDTVLLALLVAMAIVGAKKGLIRELMALGTFFIAIVLSINYIDRFAVWVYNQLGGSPLVSAFVSFVILIAGSYAGFKLIGLVFYKVANLKDSGKRDQLGGMLVGLLRGWVLVGFIAFLVFLLPMPNSFYRAFEDSLFGSSVAKTIPLMYEGTSILHPGNPNFIDKIETSLLVTQAQNDSDTAPQDRDEVYWVLKNLRQFFDTEFDGS
ncbi:MAG: hypothetical protein DRP47_01840 [Candidatus Zixiibacteriota bacterium]|nr:MAG: hypothetical protein DRP47_01840 [candidate division Zixibacteria bacterium]